MSNQGWEGSFFIRCSMWMHAETLEEAKQKVLEVVGSVADDVEITEIVEDKSWNQ